MHTPEKIAHKFDKKNIFTSLPLKYHTAGHNSQESYYLTSNYHVP